MFNAISKGVVAGLAAITAAVVLPTTPAAQGFGGCGPHPLFNASHGGCGPGGWSPGGHYVGPIGPTGPRNFATIGGGGPRYGLNAYNWGGVGQYSPPGGLITQFNQLPPSVQNGVLCAGEHLPFGAGTMVKFVGQGLTGWAIGQDIDTGRYLQIPLEFVGSCYKVAYDVGQYGMSDPLDESSATLQHSRRYSVRVHHHRHPY